MNHTIKWLTNAAFELSYKDQVLITDPSVRFMAYPGLDFTSYSKCDYVLVSHLHWDHICELKQLYARYRPSIFTGMLGRGSLVRYLNANATDVIPVYPGLSLEYGTFKLEMLFNIHRDSKTTLEKQVQALEEACKKIDDQLFGLQELGSLEMTNYQITYDDGFKVLFWGGEFSVSQHTLLKDLRPDVALVQFSDSRSDELLALLKAVNPKAVIPYHHDFSMPREKWLPMLQSFRKRCEHRFLILDNLETVVFQR